MVDLSSRTIVVYQAEDVLYIVAFMGEALYVKGYLPDEDEEFRADYNELLFNEKLVPFRSYFDSNDMEAVFKDAFPSGVQIDKVAHESIILVEYLTPVTSLMFFPDLESLYDAMLWDRVRRKDWAFLPTFGGKEVQNQKHIWSWDAWRVIKGTNSDDIEIVRRKD